jgi:hypothetical protein
MGCVIHFLFLEIASLVFVSFQLCPKMVSLVSAPPAADASIIPKITPGNRVGEIWGVSLPLIFKTAETNRLGLLLIPEPKGEGYRSPQSRKLGISYF